MENYKIISINEKNGEQRISQVNGHKKINHIYRRRVDRHYEKVVINNLAGEEKKLLEQIASNNEGIMEKFDLNKLKVDLEVTIYK